MKEPLFLALHNFDTWYYCCFNELLACICSVCEFFPDSQEPSPLLRSHLPLGVRETSQTGLPNNSSNQKPLLFFLSLCPSILTSSQSSCPCPFNFHNMSQTIFIPLYLPSPGPHSLCSTLTLQWPSNCLPSFRLTVLQTSLHSVARVRLENHRSDYATVMLKTLS